MKFEHIIHIYWTKGFFYGGRKFYFNKTPNQLITMVPGLGKYLIRILITRFELTYYRRNYWDIQLLTYQNFAGKSIIWALNLIFSQINSVNNVANDVLTLKIVKLYLIKSYRGKAHFVGKPVAGQRTWSNAWSAHRNNRILRIFVSEAAAKFNKEDRPEKINFKLIRKKRHIPRKKKVSNKNMKKQLKWF